MQLDLAVLADLATELGLVTWRQRSSSEADVLYVSAGPDAHFEFLNATDGDSLVGFLGTPWHAHPPFMFMVSPDSYTELDEMALLTAVASGELLILEHYVNGSVVDRSLHDRRAPLDDAQYLEPGEELRIRTASSIAGQPPTTD